MFITNPASRPPPITRPQLICPISFPPFWQ
jgi:hypothetical protein